MTFNDCPSESALQGYLVGNLADADAARVEAHFGECPACAARLDALTVRCHDPLLDALRHPPTDPPTAIADFDRDIAPRLAALQTATDDPPAGTELLGYTILGLLGEGGMGRVYRAHHKRLDREVAVKVVAPGRDSSQVSARFEAERHTLALMDHPNIAKVFDAGQTLPAYAGGSPRPFFVMELVVGVPVTRYCDAHRLTIRSRLELLISVCQAIHHAHQKGIIHRDIKPSNVLVTEYDGKPVPKVIDFGVAKAVGQPLMAAAQQTELGMVVGTPEYMSPEQADLNGLDIDTRSDIYSLGVLLYEVLTGDTPLARDRVRSIPLLDVLRIIREEEPPNPSTRLLATETLADVAAQRRAEPRQLRGQLRGDLDWIVMKALEKDRARRYESAAALAQDLERYLRVEPVLAGPPSAGYRLRKFVRRNRGPVAGVALVALALVSGIVGTSIGLFHARSAERRTRNERDQKDLARIDAVNSQKQTREAFDTVTNVALSELLGRQTKLTEPERAVVRKIQAQYEVFASRQGDSPEAMRERAGVYQRLARIHHWLGESDRAEKSGREAVALYGRVIDAAPDDNRSRVKLSECHESLAALFTKTNQFEPAESEIRAAQQMLADIPADGRNDPDVRRQIGSLDNALGVCLARSNVDEAEARYTASLAVSQKLAEEFPDHKEYFIDQAVVRENLGMLYLRKKRYEDAESTFRQVAALMAGADGPQVNYEKLGYEERRDLVARTHKHLAMALVKMERHADAVAAMQASRQVEQELVAEFPSLPTYSGRLGRAEFALARIFVLAKRPTEADIAFRTALKIQQRLVADYPKETDFRRDLARTHAELALLLEQQKPPIEATAAESQGLQKQSKEAAAAEYQASADVWKGLSDAEPQTAEFAFETALMLGKVAALRNAFRDFAGAQKLLDQAQPYLQRALDIDPTKTDTRKLAYGMTAHRVNALLGLGDHAAAATLADAMANSRLAPRQDAFVAAQHLATCAKLAAKDGSRPEAERAALTQNYADRAMDYLRRAVELGLSDAEILKKTRNFDPLRDRDDFQKLMHQIEK